MRPHYFRLLACLTLLVSCDNNTVRQKLRETLHVPDAPLRVESRKYGEFSPAPGVVAERVSYATAYGLRIPAIVYHPQQSRSKHLPALIIVNGHGGDKSSWYAYWAGILYARAGAVVLTYDPIGEFERNHLRESGTNQHDNLLQPEDMARRLAGLMVEDIRQSVSYLRRRKDVDHNRIAILGYSMGSFMSSLACAAETRVHACVLVGGGDLDGPNGYWDSSAKRMCQAIPYRSLSSLGEDRAALMVSAMPHTLAWNGTADTVVDIPNHGEAFFAALKQRTHSSLEYGFTPDGGHRPYFLTKPVALWLTGQLHFPNLTETDIQKMPETHISDWAAAHHLTAPGFQNQTNEGGTLALGDNMPVVNRDLLHALPESTWEANRGRYIYETWAERARVAIRAGTP